MCLDGVKGKTGLERLKLSGVDAECGRAGGQVFAPSDIVSGVGCSVELQVCPCGFHPVPAPMPRAQMLTLTLCEDEFIEDIVNLSTRPKCLLQLLCHQNR